MGFWFFLCVMVMGNLLFKAYKLRVIHGESREDSLRIAKLTEEIEGLKKEQKQQSHEARLQALEETVFFGDFELKKQFQKLEKDTQVHHHS